ncbi:MAG TPA: response regulator transcription factor [Dehalococcoidales bacterium]|jgi:DNA-binding NarL/FixJ family response regulator|nr:response regulator transcription factor [Dehalococcoidales bacterium]
MNKIKVLLVDDHAIMRDGIRALLSIHDDIKIVGEASEGQEAIEKTQDLSPDVVVMDVAMPDMDGIEATRRIRKQSPKVKVIVLTQYDNKEYVLSAIKAGAAGYVPKRALGSELVSAVRAVNRGESFLYPSAAAALIDDYRRQAKTADPYDQLTPREREILKLIAEGHSSREIADTLFISLKTVYGHRTKIMEKLGLRNRTDLFKFAVRKGLLTLDT